MTDPLLRILADLPDAEPDAVRADRLRARCHATLARRVPRTSTPPASLPRFPVRVVAGLGGLYFSEVIHQALRLYGIL